VSIYDTPPDVPDGVLVQSIVIDDEGERAGYRIFADGRYQSLSRGGDWADGDTLDAARLDAVEQAISSVPLAGLPGRYEGPGGDGEPHVLWMQVAQDGHLRTVSVLGERSVPELDELSARLTDAFRD
jgi:hypothetical protein